MSAPATRRKRPTRRSNALIGLAYLGLIGALLVVAMASYNQVYKRTTSIELRTDTVGNSLQAGSDVKLYGVPVGTVDAVRATGDGAVLTLKLDPDTADRLGSGTTARLLPKTLFGERYVALQPQRGNGLDAGAVIRQDRSQDAVELEDVLDDLLPLLQSIQPEKLSATLGEISTALRGRGDEIGDSLSAYGQYLGDLEPQVPALVDDLARLGDVADIYNDALPDALSALDSFTTTAQTLTSRRTQLTDLYAQVIRSANTTTGFVTANQNTIIVLSDESRRALEAAAPYAAEFPCLLRSLREFAPVVDSALGAGTAQPGIRVQLQVSASRGKYLPGRDAPTYSSTKTPRCPVTTGQVGTTPVGDLPARLTGPLAASSADGGAAAASATSALAAETAGLGEANSPAENQLIAELLAPTRDLAPTDYPRWASLLVGPTLRGTEVTVR